MLNMHGHYMGWDLDLLLSEAETEFELGLFAFFFFDWCLQQVLVLRKGEGGLRKVLAFPNSLGNATHISLLI